MSVDARARRTAARASSQASEALTRVLALEKVFRALSGVVCTPERDAGVSSRRDAAEHG